LTFLALFTFCLRFPFVSRIKIPILHLWYLHLNCFLRVFLAFYL
jgi:hypothetical protein